MDGTIRRLIAGEMLWKELQAWYNKLNPIWWFLNDDEPYPPAWYLPGKPSWLRFPAWYIRNPMSNFADYVIGVWCLRSQLHCHRHCALYATTWNNLPNPLPLGFKWSVIHTRDPAAVRQLYRQARPLGTPDGRKLGTSGSGSIC
jgi:hypothetical protein